VIAARNGFEAFRCGEFAAFSAFLRGEGQYRLRRIADDRCLPRIRLYAIDGRDSGQAADGGRRHPSPEKPISTNSRPASSARVRPNAPRARFSIRATSRGGSSSGSAVAVGSGVALFALGTDTAGSGRRAGGIHNIVGLKPTRVSSAQAVLVPACRSLDCVSILAHSVGDAAEYFQWPSISIPSMFIRDPRPRRALPQEKIFVLASRVEDRGISSAKGSVRS